MPGTRTPTRPPEGQQGPRSGTCAPRFSRGALQLPGLRPLHSPKNPGPQSSSGRGGAGRVSAARVQTGLPRRPGPSAPRRAARGTGHPRADGAAPAPRTASPATTDASLPTLRHLEAETSSQATDAAGSCPETRTLGAWHTPPAWARRPGRSLPHAASAALSETPREVATQPPAHSADDAMETELAAPEGPERPGTRGPRSQALLPGCEQHARAAPTLPSREGSRTPSALPAASPHAGPPGATVSEQNRECPDRTGHSARDPRRQPRDRCEVGPCGPAGPSQPCVCPNRSPHPDSGTAGTCQPETAPSARAGQQAPLPRGRGGA